MKQLPDAAATTNRLMKAFYAGKSEKTVEAYRRDLLDFAGWLKVDTVEAASITLLKNGPGNANELALGYIADMRFRDLSAATINRRLSALRALVKLASTIGIVNWRMEIRNVKTAPYRDTKGPGIEAVKTAIAAQGEGMKGIRDKAIFRLLFDLALRRGELTALDVDDVDFPAASVTIKGKGRTYRETLSLPPQSIVALQAWVSIHPTGNGALFVSLDRSGKGKSNRLTGTAIYQITKAAGLKRPHGIRHTAITEAVKKAHNAGIGIDEVLKYSRHSDLKTLMIYRDNERNAQGMIASLVSAGV